MTTAKRVSFAFSDKKTKAIFSEIMWEIGRIRLF
jgi:hypothetical protein